MLSSEANLGSRCCWKCLDLILDVSVVLVISKEVSRIAEGLVIFTGAVIRHLKSFLNPNNFTVNRV